MLKEKFYTVAEVAEITGLTQRTIRNYIKDNTLHGQKVGVQWRFTEEDIKRLFKDSDKSRKLFSLEHNLVAEFLLNTDKTDIKVCIVLDIPDLDMIQIRKLNQRLKEMQISNSANKDLKIENAAIRDEGFYRIACTGPMDEVQRIIDNIKGSIEQYVYR